MKGKIKTRDAPGEVPFKMVSDGGSIPPASTKILGSKRYHAVKAAWYLPFRGIRLCFFILQFYWSCYKLSIPKIIHSHIFKIKGPSCRMKVISANAVRMPKRYQKLQRRETTINTEACIFMEARVIMMIV